MERKSSMGHSHSSHFLQALILSHPIQMWDPLGYGVRRFSHRAAPDSGCRHIWRIWYRGVLHISPSGPGKTISEKQSGEQHVLTCSNRTSVFFRLFHEKFMVIMVAFPLLILLCFCYVWLPKSKLRTWCKPRWMVPAHLKMEKPYRHYPSMSTASLHVKSDESPNIIKYF